MHDIGHTLTYAQIEEGMRVRVIIDGKRPLLDFHLRSVYNGTKGVVKAKFWNRIWIRWEHDKKTVPWFSLPDEAIQFLERVKNRPRTRPNKYPSNRKRPK